MSDALHTQHDPSLLRQYQSLLAILEAIAAERDLASLLKHLAERLRSVVAFDAVTTILHDPASDLMCVQMRESASLESVELPVSLPIESSPGGWVMQAQQPLIIPDIELEERFPELVKLARQSGLRSHCFLPLTVAGRQLGALGFGRVQPSDFAEADLGVLQRVANQVAVAVENATNLASTQAAEAELKHNLQQLQFLLEVNNGVVSHLDLRDLFGAIASHLRRMFPHSAAGLTLYDPARQHLRILALDISLPGGEILEENESVPLTGTPAGVAFETRQTLIVSRRDLEQFSSPLVQRVLASGVQSGLLAPLIAHGRVLGTIDLASVQDNAFSAKHAELLTQIASQIAIAVDNALNFERARKAEQEVKQQLERERLMLEINNAVVTQLDLRELARVTAARLRELLQHDITGISLYDAETNQFRAYMFDLPDSLPPIPEGTPMPLEGTVGGIAFRSGQPVFMSRPDAVVQSSEFDRRLMEAGVQSGGVIPLIAHDKKLGFLGVGSFREDAFSPADQELLCHIANQIAIAVENALNFERAQLAEQEAKRQSERLQLLLQVNNAIASALDLPSLFRTVSACLRQVFRHDYAVMGLYNEQEEILRVYALDRGEGIDILQEGQVAELDNTPVGLAIRTKQVVVTGRDYLAQFPSEVVRRAVSQGIRANCSAPLLRKNRVIGAMSMASKTELAFSKDDGEFFMQIADQVAIAVENALAYQEIEGLKNKLASEKLYLEDEIRTEHNFEELIGASRAFKRILKQIETVAPTDSTVLIRGETGTGKELIARAIHNLSNRRERTLVKLNCAAIPTGLLESELFGHEKGAFTGAITQRIGRFELANHGTLLLDEIGDIPVELQPKLLRVLQEQEFERLGSTRTQKVNVRLIAATNADLEQLVAEKKYRSDLYYRLNVFPVTIPPLRERAEDVPLLARFFTRKYARRMKKPIEAIPAEAMEALTAYHWPGNVRELEHFIERAVVLTQGTALEISQSELKPARMPAAMSVAMPGSSSGAPPITTLEAAEREHILRALEETNWVIGGPQGAAARLGMKRTTLQSRMQKLGITR